MALLTRYWVRVGIVTVSNVFIVTVLSSRASDLLLLLSSLSYLHVELLSSVGWAMLTLGLMVEGITGFSRWLVAAAIGIFVIIVIVTTIVAFITLVVITVFIVVVDDVSVAIVVHSCSIVIVILNC